MAQDKVCKSRSTGTNSHQVLSTFSSRSQNCQSQLLRGPNKEAKVLLAIAVLNLILLSSIIRTLQKYDRLIIEDRTSTEKQLRFKLDANLQFDKQAKLHANYLHSGKGNGELKILMPAANKDKQSTEAVQRGKLLRLESDNKLNSMTFLQAEKSDEQILLLETGNKFSVRQRLPKSTNSQPILEADAEANTILLSGESLPRLSGGASSLLVEDEVNLPQLSGTSDRDLSLISMNGDLNCESNSQITIVSKAASVNMQSQLDLTLDANQVQFNTKDLRFKGNSISYFESIPNFQNWTDGDPFEFEQQLQAFELMAAVDGTLVAVDMRQ